MKIRYVLPLLLTVFTLVTPAQAATPSISVSDVSYSNTISISSPAKKPTCKAYFTYKRPYVGEATELLWRSKKATYMTGLFTAEQRPAEGSQRIIFGHAGKQHFELTFVGSGGVTTCALDINVKERPAA